MNLETIDSLMDKYSLLLKIKYNNGSHNNDFLNDEIFDTKQRLIAQQVPQEALEALEGHYKIK